MPLQKLLQHGSIATKLRLLALVSIASLLVIAIWVGFDNHRQGYEARQGATRNTVEAAWGILEWAHAQELSGTLNREAAQELARSAISKLRYSGNEYFWINDLQPRVVMHPFKPELNGQDASGIKDPNGKALFVAFADMVRQHKQGFVAYQWPKPGADQAVDKLSYVKGFEPWGWVIGSGIYIDDLHAATVGYAQRLTAVVVLTMVLLVVLSGRISNSIVNGLQRSIQLARAIADGDISQDIKPHANDEVGQLMSAMADMTLKLRGMVGVVKESAQSMETASSEIAAGNHDLSIRTEQTAANLSQTASAMGQISGSADNTAQSACEAAGLASAAAQTATQGNEVVTRVVATMDDISAASRRIGDITGVIDGIAFQTNILALNAAVEAARAGEQGRGFAVVASEVRSLAQRSAEAAREIKSLIGDSVGKVQTGSDLVAAAGSAMHEVVSSVQRVHGLVTTMQSENQQLTTGVSDISQTMSDLERNTSQNSALVEQSAAATQSLRDQAVKLNEAVSVFKLS